MFCKYCGTKLIDHAVFCHTCGQATNESPAAPQPTQPAAPVQPAFQQPVPPVQPAYQQPMYQAPAQPVFQQPVYQAPAQPVFQQPMQPAFDPMVAQNLEKQALTCGILGLCLSLLGVPGIIFSAIAGSKVSELKKLTGQLSSNAKTGHGLAKAGKIIGIIATVAWALALPSLLNKLLNFFTFDNPFEHFSF